MRIARPPEPFRKDGFQQRKHRSVRREFMACSRPAGIVSCKWRGIKDEFRNPRPTVNSVLDVGRMLPSAAAAPAGAVKRIRAPNASALTGSGTNTYLVSGRRQVAVIDPGPDRNDHFRRILSEVGPSHRISKILVTHPHADHTELVPRLAERTGAEVIAHSGGGRGPARSECKPWRASSNSEAGRGSTGSSNRTGGWPTAR